MQKPKHKISLIEAQHRRLDALDRWFQFINDERVITPENFAHELLGPTMWGAGRRRSGGTGLTNPAEVEGIKMKVADGLKVLAEGRQWIIRGADLGHFDVVISELGTSYEGGARARSLLGIADLLQGGGWRSAACSWCGKLFLKKKRGTYCSLICSQRMRTFKVRDPRSSRVIASAKKDGVPIAAWLKTHRKPEERRDPDGTDTSTRSE